MFQQQAFDWQKKVHVARTARVACQVVAETGWRVFTRSLE
jgi:hypothetical protein